MRARSNPKGGESLRTVALLVAYPALRELPRIEWEDALARARETGFDAIELIGVVAGVAFATYLLRFDANQAVTFTLSARYLIQFIVAAPLLALLVGPFYLRRTRRGLDREIERRQVLGLSNLPR